MNRVFIYIENGVLQYINASDPDDLKVTVVDRDDDAIDPLRVYYAYGVTPASVEEIDRWTDERLKEEEGE